MRGSIFAFSRRGCVLGQKIAQAIPGDWALYTSRRLQSPPYAPIPQPSADFYGERFQTSQALIFVGSCGIAVRAIAAHVADKRLDPAVVCVDELGRFVIPLLSGHIGGANALAEKLAQALGAVCAVTTATDINGRFSVDTWAVQQGLILSGKEEAKAVSAAILEGDVPLCSDFPISGKLPAGVAVGNGGAVGIYLTCGTGEPFDTTLRLIPKIIHLGIGCRRGTSCGDIARAVERAFGDNHLDLRAVKAAASIDLKATEPGLLEYCREREIPVSFYTAQELMAVPGEFPPSDFVKQITGVDNVCQRSAMVRGSRLLIHKTAYAGVTVAAAAEEWEARFE